MRQRNLLNQFERTLRANWLTIVVTSFWLGPLSCPSASCDDAQNVDDTAGVENTEEDDRAAPNAAYVRLGTVRELKPIRSTAASPAEADKIRQLIGKLATIDRPDFGLSGTMTGRAFLPVEGASQIAAGLITDHRLTSSSELRKLVAYGPKAMPFLLAALDDRTPTKLTMTHRGVFGGMWHENEMGGNPVNALEQRVLAGKARQKAFADTIDTYTVAVGDVCYVALGQIAGRWYHAVRYQPTNIIIINSPTRNEEILKMTREIWASDDAGQKLLDSLLIDYATEGIFNGHSLDGWDRGSDLQAAAAMRLLYYFPQESAAFIAERIDKLDLLATDGDPDSPDAYMKQCVANGVRANEFLEAVASCDEPPIRAALSRAFDRAGDLHVILATAPAAGEVDAAKVRRKLVERIEALEENDAGPYGDGFNLLVALGKSGGDESKEVFKDYLTTLTVARRRTMCHVLRQVRREWAAELLAEFLTDRREIGRWTYAVDPDDSERRLPLRICDEAAVTIAAVNEQLEFNIQGSHADMNERIDVLKARVKELKH